MKPICTMQNNLEKVYMKELDRVKEIERSIVKKYHKEIWTNFVKAVKEYELIKEGDRI